MNSAGIALARTVSSTSPDGLAQPTAEILIVHPGGPLWAGKDHHGWSIPKGIFDPDVERSEDAARREFAEELGMSAPNGQAHFLGSFRAGRKTIWPWLVMTAASPDLELLNFQAGHRFPVESNKFEMEWPPRSGQRQQFPEVDEAQWTEISELADKLHKGQLPLVEKITEGLRAWAEDPSSFTTW